MKLKKSRLLLLLAAAVATTLASATPPAARALVCPEGSTLSFGTIYYTNASKTVIFCQNYACGGGTCNGQTTSFFTLTRECCMN